MQWRSHRYRAGLQKLGLSLVVAALAAFVGRTTPGTSTQEANARTRSFVVPTNCVSCSTCALSTIRHVAAYDVNGDFKNPHSDCLDFPGCSGHPACGAAAAPDEIALEDALANAFRGDSAAARELFTKFSGRVQFNVHRMAIQVTGCQAGTIMAHLPLDARQFEAIADLPQVRQDLASR
jgi:hypothetical protein